VIRSLHDSSCAARIEVPTTRSRECHYIMQCSIHMNQWTEFIGKEFRFGLANDFARSLFYKFGSGSRMQVLDDLFKNGFDAPDGQSIRSRCSSKQRLED
jgi:hypothetical protein